MKPSLFGRGRWGRGLLRSCLGMSAALTLTASAGAAEPTLRRWPFPFEHVITFSSDVDMQTPWYGAAFHRAVNERLGLGLSDSLWVSGSGAGYSHFLAGPSTLNRSSGGWGAMPSFALLLRQWHRGNVDHFHSWQSDVWLRLLQSFEPGLSVRHGQTIAMNDVPPSLAAMNYNVVRLYFDGRPPSGLGISGVDAEDNRFFMENAGKAAVVESEGRYRIDIVLSRAGSSIVAQSEKPVTVAKIARIEMHAAECVQECAVRLTRIERDGLSREVIEAQWRLLEAFNLRPPFLTSHGGNTYAQNFGYPGCCAPLPGSPDPAAGKETVSLSLKTEAALAKAPGYHADILEKLGVVGIWPIRSLTGQTALGFRDRLKLEPFLGTRFYAFPRSYLEGTFASDTAGSFASTVRAAAGGVEDFDAEQHFCAGAYCSSSALGSQIGLLSDLGLFAIGRGEKIENHWATHFGTMLYDKSHDARPEQPLRPRIAAAMRALADHVYNVSGAIPAAHRTWVPAVGTLVRYQIAMRSLSANSSVDEANSRVSIRSWVDPVLGRRYPDLAAGTRDLHGATFYVRDATQTAVDIDGVAVETFTRNPADASGRQSVTIVGNTGETAILGAVPLALRGRVQFLAGRAAAARAGYVAFQADENGEVSVDFQPSSLGLWNTSHLHLSSIFQGRDRPSPLRASLRLTMDGDRTIEIATSQQRLSDVASWQLDVVGDNPRLHATFSTTELRWPAGATVVGPTALAAPIGVVRDVKLRLAGLLPDEKVELRLSALRPNSNGLADDGHALLAGRVTLADGSGVGGVTVKAASAASEMRVTATDADGFFYFSHLRRGQVATLLAEADGEFCYSQAGRQIELLRDEAEADINLAYCGSQSRSDRPRPPSSISDRRPSPYP